jgi:hypothetical protein
MPHFLVVVCGMVMILLFALRLSSLQALDGETARLEALALCQSMPYTCPTGTPPTTSDERKIPVRRPVPAATQAPGKTRPPIAKAARQPTPSVGLSPTPAVASAPTPHDRPATSPVSPTTKNAIDTVVYGCASAAGIDPHGTINTSQMLALTSCVDRSMGR